MRRTGRAVLVASLLAMASEASAGDMLPAGLQAALLKKVVAYDQTLGGRAGAVRVLIAATAAQRGAADDLTKALSAIGFEVTTAEPGKSAALVGQTDVLYVFEAQAALLAEAARGKVLTVTGDRPTVEAGNASVAIVPEAGKPKLVVHAARMKAESHALAASVLSFCQVIR